MAAENAKSGALEKIVNMPGVTKSFTRLDQDRKWLLVDADGHSVGRLATQIAGLLRGKHKPTFTRHDDVGDFVVVVNASGLIFRGNDKAKKKKYYLHTGYFGHLKERTADKMLEEKPERVLMLAVKRMIPEGALRNRMLKKLKIFAGPEHTHKAQKPEAIQLVTTVGKKRAAQA